LFVQDDGVVEGSGMIADGISLHVWHLVGAPNVYDCSHVLLQA
jgi:hypothetical protein